MHSINAAQQTCIIIDDDEISISILNNFIDRIENLNVTATFTDPIDGVLAIREMQEIDFLFLDIGMEVSGLDIAKLLRDHVKYLVFITFHEKYALDAFNVYCDRFIVKPITFEKINSTILELTRRDKR
ncbi:hypothetical protein ASE74_22620 [Pedobacter sp. Leaf216]|uniref:LytR/AlgR family response regulator transcription factor n=1 Tax=Pedobacter sp. Leaf216 TaxID=1735684 RepID=UPI0006F3B896|nr:response regulator [Pedobacter sp. Leaf216]KQM72671.1 hypothetical protein ASE74_22620 [Pedobacter sp. Leaf216]